MCMVYKGVNMEQHLLVLLDTDYTSVWRTSSDLHALPTYLLMAL